MKTAIQILFVALIIQMGLTFYLYSGDSRLAAYTPDQQLLDLDKAAVASIVVSEGEDTSLTLKKGDAQGWVLPDHYNFPASPARVEALINSVMDAKRPFPVGNTIIAAKQFEVTKDSYQKKMEFFTSEEEPAATIYLGTSPGFKKTHLRVEGEEFTYAFPVSSHEVSTATTYWYDKDFLHLEEDQITKLSFPELTLAREEEKGLVVPDAAEGMQTNEAERNKLVADVAALNFIEVLGTDETTPGIADEPALQYTITINEAEPTTYAFYSPTGEEDSYYVLKTSTHPYYFSIPKGTVDRLQSITRDRLLEELLEEHKDAMDEAEASTDANSEQSESADLDAAQ